MNRILQNHADKLGLVGTIFTVGCCLGLPGFLPLAAAVGFGFMTNMAVVKPLLLVVLAVTVAGLFLGFRRHHKLYPLAASVVAAITIYWFMFVSYRPLLIQASVIVLVAATLLNLFWMRREERACRS